MSKTFVLILISLLSLSKTIFMICSGPKCSPEVKILPYESILYGHFPVMERLRQTYNHETSETMIRPGVGRFLELHVEL